MSSSSSDEDEDCRESLVEVNPEEEEGLDVLLVLRPSNQNKFHTRLFLSTTLVQKLVRKLKGRSHRNLQDRRKRAAPMMQLPAQAQPRLSPGQNFHRPIPVLHPGHPLAPRGIDVPAGGHRSFHPYPNRQFYPHQRPYLGGGRGKFRRGGPWRFGRPFQPGWGPGGHNREGIQTQTRGWMRYGGPPYPPQSQSHLLLQSPPPRPFHHHGQGQFQLQREIIPQMGRYEGPGSPLVPPPQHWMEDEEYVPQPIVRDSNREREELRSESESEEYDDDYDSSSVSSVSSEEVVSEGEDFGLRAYVAGITRVGTGGVDKAGFGVWFGEGHEMNFGGAVPTERPQVLKAALIYGGAQCVTALKEKGYSHVDICMESDYLVKNVSGWLEKSKADAEFDISKSSNWDEYKYFQEIRDLCVSFQGMRINWMHLPTKSEGIEKAKKIALEVLLRPPPSDNEP